MNLAALPSSQLANAVRHACELEVRAFKPGNVSMVSPGHGMSATQFIASAEAMADPLCAPGLRIGQRVLDAVTATRAAVACNTNLGIVLLAAPLVQASLLPSDSADLRARVKIVLSELDVADADLTYQAIRHAAPGGLGTSEQHDVAEAPQVTLLQAMAEASVRDAIARAYVDGYTDVFDLGIPLIRAALIRWESEEWAMVAAFLGLLARVPDTHIERKFGFDTANQVSQQAAEIEKRFQLASDPVDCLQSLHEFDQSLKRAGINPGTSADFTVASFLAMCLQEKLREMFGHADDTADGLYPGCFINCASPRLSFDP